MKWINDLNKSYGQNQRDFKEYMREQEKCMHRTDYVPPSPKHRDPLKEWLDLHLEWNPKTAKIIEGSLPSQALRATLGALSYSNDTYRKNILPFIKLSAMKGTATRNLERHSSRNFQKVFSECKRFTSPSLQGLRSYGENGRLSGRKWIK